MSKANGVVSTDDARVLLRRISFWRAASWNEVMTRGGYFILATILAGTFVFPIYWLLKISIMWPSPNLYGGTPSLWIQNPSLYNFVDVIFTINFPRYLLNNFIIVTMVIASNLVVNSFAAYALTLDFHGRRLAQGFLVANMMIPAQTVIIPAFLVLKNLGLLNNHLGVILPLATIIINIFILYTSFDAVPDSIIESARLDGASELYIIFGVYWPLSKAALATNVILAFVFAWNTYIWPLLVIRDRALRTLPLALADFQGTYQGSVGVMYAFTLLAVLPVVLMFLLLQKQFIESVVMSSIKE